MDENRKINILMVDKQAMKLADPLEEFLNMSADGLIYTLGSCDNYAETLSTLDGVDIALVELDLTKEYSISADKDFLPWIEENNAGYRFLAYLKKEHPHIKVIMLVDYPACEDLPSEITEITEKGADKYLVKPFVISKLVEEIQRVSEEGTATSK